MAVPPCPAIVLQSCGQCRWGRGNNKMIDSCTTSLDVEEYLVKAVIEQANKYEKKGVHLKMP